MNQAETKTYHDTINAWRYRMYKIKAYQRQLEQELDPAKEEWDAAFEKMTALEAEQEANKVAIFNARQHTNTIY